MIQTQQRFQAFCLCLWQKMYIIFYKLFYEDHPQYLITLNTINTFKEL